MRQVHKLDLGLKKTLKKNRKCQHCGAVFRTNGLLYFHLRKVHNIRKPIKCKVCGGNFTPGAMWYDHKKLHPEHFPCYTCSECESKFFTLTNLNKHLLQSGHRHDVESPTGVKDGDGSSADSGMNIETNGADNDHSDVCENSQTMNSVDDNEIDKQLDQGSGSNSAENLLNNIMEGLDTDQSVMCEIDISAAAIGGSMTGQVTSGRSKETSVALSNACPKCSKSFKHYSTYQRHIYHNLCFGIDAKPMQKPVTNGIARTQPKTPAGGIPSAVVTNPKRHTNGIAEPTIKKNPSPYLKKVYARSSTKNPQHASRIRNGLLLCCEKFYDTFCEYRQHIQEHFVRNDENRKNKFQCPVCKKLVDTSGLWYHALKHSGINLFSCDQCDYRCILETDLAKHKRSHTDVHPHQCRFCSRKFRQKLSLLTHENQHLGVKHKCGKCHRQFYDKSRRNGHQRKCLGKSQARAVAIPTKSPGSLGYLCNRCFGLCFYRTRFTSHQKECRSARVAQSTVKLNVKDKCGQMRKVPLDSLHMCQICSQVFERECDLKMHRKACKLMTEFPPFQNGQEKRKVGKRVIRSLNRDDDDEIDTTLDAGGDYDVSDVVEHDDDQQLPDMEGDCMHESHTASPASKVAKRKLPNGTRRKKRKRVICAGVSAAVVCRTCNKTTEEIIRQECTSHEIFRPSKQGAVDNQVNDDHNDVQHQNGSSPGKRQCSKCRKSTETLLQQHRCPQFFCRKCKQVYTSKTVLDEHNASCEGKPSMVIYQCPVCRMHLTSKSDFQAHVRKHKQKKKSQEGAALSYQCKKKQPMIVFQCHVCKQCFPNKSDLIIHIRTHKQMPQESVQQVTVDQHQKRKPMIVYQCPVCKHNFPNNSELDLHIKSQCQTLGSHKTSQQRSTHQCHLCKQRFSVESNLRIHLRTHSDSMPHGCQYCYSCYGTNDELMAHMTDKHKELLQLIRCGKVMKSWGGFHDHILSVHEGSRYTCEICGITVKWKNNLTVHMRQMHKHDTGIKRTQQKNRKCQHCGTVFRTNGLLYFHLRKVHNVRNPIKCNVCGGNFSPGQQWNDHKKLHPEHFPCYTCSVCESKFFTLSFFQKHLLRSGLRHDVGSQKDVIDNGNGLGVESDSNVKTNDAPSCHNQSVVCEKIQTVDSIGNEENSKHHDRGASGDNAENILNDIIDGHDIDESGLCETDKTADPANDVSITGTIANAVSEGSDKTPCIACPKCSKPFKNYISYQQHVFHKACSASGTSRHIKRDKLVCCGKIYDTHQEYTMHTQIHYVRKEGKKKKYECPDCKKLIDHSSLWYHAMKHSEMYQFSCGQCDYRCILETDLIKHKRSHMDAQPYQCKFCSRRFRSSLALGTHENFHLGVKHKCAKCGHQFYDKARCKRHQRACLGNGGSRLTMPVKSPGSLGYLCNKCFGLCYYRTRFTSHQRECRSERVSQSTVKLNVKDKCGQMREVPLESLHNCQICSQVFEQESDLDTHRVNCRVTRRRRKRKANEGNVNRDHEYCTTIDVAGDDDMSDDVEHEDQQLPDGQGDGMNVSHTASPASKLAERKLSKSSPSKKRKNTKCSSISTDVVCHACNKSTEEIIRRECTSHKMIRLSEQSEVDHQVIDECTDKDVHCSKCKTTKETLLLEHKCTPQFNCKRCKKVFTSKTVLEAHQTCKERKPSKEYKWPVCKINFTRKSDLQAHVRSHKQVSQMVQDETTSQCKKKNQPRAIFQCAVCNQTFPNRSDITVHLETHKQKPQETANQHQDRSPKKKCRCPLCKQSFPNKKDCNLHLRNQCQIQKQIPQVNVQHLSASQLKRLRARLRKENQSGVVYHCPICKEKFPNKKDRNLHFRNQCDTGNQIPQENMQHAPVHQDQERKPMILHQCLVCKQNFPDNSDLDLHIRSLTCLSREKTQQITPYRCQFCKNTFSVESNLHIHLRTHSNEMPHRCDYCYLCYGTHNELTTHMTEKHTKLLHLITVVKNGLPP